MPRPGSQPGEGRSAELRGSKLTELAAAGVPATAAVAAARARAIDPGKHVFIVDRRRFALCTRQVARVNVAVNSALDAAGVSSGTRLAQGEDRGVRDI